MSYSGNSCKPADTRLCCIRGIIRYPCRVVDRFNDHWPLGSQDGIHNRLWRSSLSVSLRWKYRHSRYKPHCTVSKNLKYQYFRIILLYQYLIIIPVRGYFPILTGEPLLSYICLLQKIESHRFYSKIRIVKFKIKSKYHFVNTSYFDKSDFFFIYRWLFYIFFL